MKEKQKLSYQLPCNGITIEGYAYSLVQLTAMFQIWARQYGITDQQSLALWVAHTPKAGMYFKEGEAEEIAQSAAVKLPKNNPIFIEMQENPKGSN